MTLQHRNGYTMESFTAGAGLRRHLIPTARSSSKSFERAVSLVSPHVAVMVAQCLNVDFTRPFQDGETYKAALGLITV